VSPAVPAPGAGSEPGRVGLAEVARAGQGRGQMPDARPDPRLARLADGATLAGLLGFVYAVKRFYAGAGADDLGWILGPTAVLAGGLVGAPFAREPAYGFVNVDLRFAIVPACAGLNFLAIAFCALVSVLTLGAPARGRRLAWLVPAAAAAYGATVAANAVRIALAVALHRHPLEAGWLTAARLHRLEGVVVYVAALLVLCELARRSRRRLEDGR